MAQASQVQSYNSFSGVDIVPMFNGKAIGEIQAISYSINREKAPVYTMGSANPRSFARGKRGIAGSLIFIVFDRHALLSEMGASRFSADTDETGVVRVPAGSIAGAGADLNENVNQAESFGQSIVAPWYVDQIPAFDIVLAAANEYGATATMAIYGAEILNENSGVSIDDIVTEQQYTYICRNVTPWKVGESKKDQVYSHTVTG
jgi:hypothetical protein